MVNESAVVVFDDERAVANVGVMLPALLAQRLGIQELVDQCVDLGERPGAANPGRKVMTMCSAMTLGADCIEDCDLLRSGQTAAVLGHRVAAPSTLGTFLRSFTFGHVRQLDRVLGLALERAWAAGAGPGDGRLIVDVDSFVGEVHGYAKQGAGYGYIRQLGYHPLLATRADTGEVLHIRLRKGSANGSIPSRQEFPRDLDLHGLAPERALELGDLRAQLVKLGPFGLPGQALSAGGEELLPPLAQQAVGDVVLTAQLRVGLGATQRREHDLGLLLRGELPWC
ncbi:MAG: transposase [Conexibacter sp.]|nr:transposase [Solirubrobacterales bacterium]MCW3004800.1 transposase [Conexibacter sp.]